MEDIQKIAGVILRGKKLLVARDKGGNYFKIPGGKMDKGESKEETLIRELKEELSIDITSNKFLETFRHKAATHPCDVVIDCHFVEFNGELKPNEEVEELKFISRNMEVPVGSVISECIVPKLVEMDLM